MNMTPEGRIVEPEETSIIRQWLGKHVPSARNTQAAKEEFLEALFSVGSAPRLYNEEPRPAEIMTERVECCVQLNSAKDD
jgi:hypothetical protein